MTEKRFKEVYPNILSSNYNFTDNGKGISDKEVCELLNKQNEQIDFLASILSKLSAYMIALGFDIELEYKDGRTINLTNVMNDDG